MQADGPIFETSDALAASGVNRVFWNNLMRRGLYSAAPPVEAGLPRYFTVDDVLCLFVLDDYQRRGVNVAMSARIATAVSKALKKNPAAEALWIVATSSGTPHGVVATQPPPELFADQIPVAHLRRRIQQIAVERGLAS